MHAWAHRCQYSCALQLACECIWRVAAHEHHMGSRQDDRADTSGPWRLGMCCPPVRTTGCFGCCSSELCTKTQQSVPHLRNHRLCVRGRTSMLPLGRSGRRRCGWQQTSSLQRRRATPRRTPLLACSPSTTWALPVRRPHPVVSIKRSLESSCVPQGVRDRRTLVLAALAAHVSWPVNVAPSRGVAGSSS